MQYKRFFKEGPGGLPFAVPEGGDVNSGGELALENNEEVRARINPKVQDAAFIEKFKNAISDIENNPDAPAYKKQLVAHIKNGTIVDPTLRTLDPSELRSIFSDITARGEADAESRETVANEMAGDFSILSDNDIEYLVLKINKDQQARADANEERLRTVDTGNLGVMSDAQVAQQAMSVREKNTQEAVVAEKNAEALAGNIRLMVPEEVEASIHPVVEEVEVETPEGLEDMQFEETEEDKLRIMTEEERFESMKAEHALALKNKTGIQFAEAVAISESDIDAAQERSPAEAADTISSNAAPSTQGTAFSELPEAEQKRILDVLGPKKK